MINNLEKIIDINKNFQNSINLQLDLKDYNKVSQYIPTGSSVRILERYMMNISENRQEKATILIGPYGKGKSHLLLILLSIFTKGIKPYILEELGDKVGKINVEAGKIIKEEAAVEKKFLPVIISGFSDSMENSFLYGIHNALKENELENINLDSYYSEALKIINNWGENYKSTYEDFNYKIKNNGQNIEDFKIKLENYDKEALEYFKELYPQLTSGAEFKPIVNTDIFYLYKNINEILCRDYNYRGILIIFDEFSKFIEGYNKHMSRDMKLLQDICELCNNKSKNSQMHIILVAHKNIQEYGKHLNKSTVNSFEGVQGRLREILFITSSKSNYELIKNAIRNNNDMVNQFYMRNPNIKNELMELYGLPIFRGIVTEREFETIILEGCFPIYPVATFVLLHISEMAAQNERTLFTFISKDEPYSLVRFVKNYNKNQDCFLGIDYIYDYFKEIFRSSFRNDRLHIEWIKAEYSISKAETSDERKLIKTLALIEIINMREEFSASEENLRKSIYWKKDRLLGTIKSLSEKGLIIKRKKYGAYTFKNQIDVDIEGEIKKIIQKDYEKINLCEELWKISRLDYVFPKKYNQQFSMTRYFKYKFMKYEDFMSINNSKFLFEEQEADGVIIILVSGDTTKKEAINNKLKELESIRIVVILPSHEFSKEYVVKEYMAVKRLRLDEEFIYNNKAILEELNLYEEDFSYEINSYIEKNYLPENKRCSIHSLAGIYENFYTRAGFNRLLSNICSIYYNGSPKINNEMINRRNISSQTQKARKKIVEHLLNKSSFDGFLKGTSAEATIFRSSLISTGVINSNKNIDDGVYSTLKIINQFVENSGDERQSFKKLYDRLLGEGIGIRKGILPIYLAYEFSKLDGMAVIYFKEKELSIDSQILEHVNAAPERYMLYVERAAIEKNKYLEGIGEIFDIDKGKGNYVTGDKVLRTVDGIISWYRSLPRYTVNLKYNKKYKKLNDFLQVLGRIDYNPRELIFEELPSIFGEKYGECIKNLQQVKKYLDSHMKVEKRKNIDYLKNIFEGSGEGNLCNILKHWYLKHEELLNNSVQSSYVKGFVSLIKNIKTYDEDVIINSITKLLTGLYIEDWNEGSFYKFDESVRELLQEIEALNIINKENKNKRKFSYINNNGQERTKYFEFKKDSTSDFFRNAIEDTIEEFGESLGVNQKISVLVEILENL